MQGAVGEGREKIIIASARASESRGASRGGATGVVNPSKNRCTQVDFAFYSMWTKMSMQCITWPR